jgi:hypothetical protein
LADEPVSRILRPGKNALFESTAYRKQRTYAVRDVNCVTHARITGTRWAHLLCGIVLLLFSGAVSAQQRTFTIPFRTVGGMILLDAVVDGKAASLLLDTGANNTIISPQAAGLVAKLDALKATKTTGAAGEYVKARVDLRLAERHWIDRAVLVMDLQEFSAVRIDFKQHTVEFMQS